MGKLKKRTHTLNRNKKLYEFDDIKPLVMEHLSKMRELKRNHIKENIIENNLPLSSFY